MELSKQDVTVQPTYLYGDGRKSEQYERRAMSEILELLWKHPQTKARILPLETVDINTITPIKEISDAYHNIIRNYKLGSQYEWIGWYAAINPGCELCVEQPHSTGIGYMSKIIKSAGEIVPTKDVHNYKVESRSKDVMLLIGNVYFPIKDKTEIDMVNLIKEWGYEDVMKHIWFCHNPLKGKPCGMCRPCAEKMESDMDFLLSSEAQKRYRFATKYGDTILYKIYKKLLHKMYP